jgi:NAD(P)-dependent dehydrogenase (short-subunit alcohol dehydrogenase family)
LDNQQTRARKLRDGGSITLTSGTGGRAQEIAANYVANVGIEALVRGLASELAPRIRVNAVAPTFIGTGKSFGKDMPALRARKDADRDQCERGTGL